MVKHNYQLGGLDFDAKDPFYSPVYASYNKGWPKTVITTGARNVALSSSIRLFWKMREGGVKVELLVGEGM